MFNMKVMFQVGCTLINHNVYVSNNQGDEHLPFAKINSLSLKGLFDIAAYFFLCVFQVLTCKHTPLFSFVCLQC